MARKGSRKRLNKRGGEGDAPVAPAEENMFSKFTGELKGKVADNIKLKVDELKENTANHAKALKEEADKMKGNITGITSGITEKMAGIFSKTAAPEPTATPPPAGGRRRRSTKRKTAKRSSSKRSSSKRSRSKRSRTTKRKTNKRKRVRFSMRSRSKRRH